MVWSMSGLSLLDVTHGPSFIYEPPQRVLIANTSGGSIPCSAHGVPPPAISWLDSMEQPATNLPGIAASHQPTRYTCLTSMEQPATNLPGIHA